MLVGILLNFGGSQAICFPLLLDFLTTAIAMVSVPGLFVPLHTGAVMRYIFLPMVLHYCTDCQVTIMCTRSAAMHLQRQGRGRDVKMF